MDRYTQGSNTVTPDCNDRYTTTASPQPLASLPALRDLLALQRYTASVQPHNAANTSQARSQNLPYTAGTGGPAKTTSAHPQGVQL